MPAYVDPDAYRIVSVRLRRAEYECFTAQTEALGISHSRALRIAARRIAGFLEIDAATRTSMCRISEEIGQISTSLRQLSRIAVRDGSVDMQRFMADRSAFGREFTALDTLLQSILSVSLRRQDGMTILKDADRKSQAE
ncbi:T-DNA border endonuclease VirD1 (plasmid) [Agrobacterium vitis]|nr:T-DNA border endonuclease VirD1 [Agrobacterium vitis]